MRSGKRRCCFGLAFTAFVVAAPWIAHATPAVHAIDVVHDEVRHARVEMKVSSGPSSGLRPRYAPQGFARDDSEGEVSFAVDASAMAGRLRATFRANGKEGSGFQSGGRQNMSIDYDLWETRGRVMGRRYEFATSLKHALSLDSARDESANTRKDAYRTNNALIVRGRIADLRLSLRQGWSGAYAVRGESRRTDARQSLEFSAELPLADVFDREGEDSTNPFSPRLLVRASQYNKATTETAIDFLRESGFRSAVGVAFGRERWAFEYLGHQRSQTRERGGSHSATLHAVGHDVSLALRLTDSLNFDMDLAWESIEDAGQFRTESDHSADIGWRLFENASLAIGVFSRERDARDAGTKNSRRGIETRLELPVRPFARWRPLASLGGRFVVKQDLSMNVADRSGAGGTTSREGVWSVLCSLELTRD